MRWLHESIDRLHLRLMRLLFASRAFQQGVVSPPFAEHIAAVRLQMPDIVPQRQQYNLAAQTLVGEVEAGFFLRRGAHPTMPVLLYHHGIAEMPPTKTFHGLFPRWRSVPAHLLAVRAPFHRSWWELKASMRTVQHFLAMCAVSVVLMETLRQALHAQGAQHCLIAGCSLGGVVALLHHITYNTAERYVPLLAGPDVAHVLLTTPYRYLLHPHALRSAEVLQAQLNFAPALPAMAATRVFPLLARYDVDMCYAHQQACYAARGIPVVAIARGHITGNLGFARLRAHILRQLRFVGQAASLPESEARPSSWH